MGPLKGSFNDRGYSRQGSLGVTPLLVRSWVPFVRVLAGVTLVRGVSGLPRCLFDRGYLADAARPGTTIVLEHASADPPGAILQWWAGWMKDCNTLGSAPQSYFLALPGLAVRFLLYAGVRFTGHVYTLY